MRSNIGSLTTLLVLVVVAIIPSAMGIDIAWPRVHMLEVQVRSEPREPECEAGLRAVVVVVEAGRFAVGEEGRRRAWVHTIDALRRELRSFKDAQPARQHVVVDVDVDDGVPYERVVFVLDAALDVQLGAITINANPAVRKQNANSGRMPEFTKSTLR